MINVKDLRIGNYINANGLKGHFTVFAIAQASCDFIVDGMLCESYEKNLQPIPITPEWLIKLGFTQHHNALGAGFTRRHQDGEFDHKDNENVIILCEDIGYTFDYEMGGIEWCQCSVEYVHQLQNHFYLMTGEELTIGGGE